MKYQLFIFFITFALSFTIFKDEKLNDVPYPFSVCGNGTWTMNSLTLSQPPGRNVDIQIDASGTANDHIDFKSVELVVKLNGLFLHSQSVAFEKSFDQDDVVDFIFHSYVPSFAPGGSYTMSFTYKDTAGKQNGCWSFAWKF